ncbi:condensation domain-containing protein [Crocosphaera sp. Alani8]|uniref:condensation domain-containing protein n=1 Tax=Crocosphaera sp. Alani8 TaxID=3038952 RepID=UPI00313CA639
MVLSAQKKQSKKNIEDIYSLSPLQKGLLFHSLYEQNSGIYSIQLSVRLSGSIDKISLKKAWQQVVNRHSVLRTFFIWEKRETPLQIVRKQAELPWISHDWRHFSKEQQELELEALLKTEQKQGFDLRKAPLMRCTLIQLEDEAFQFIWSYHHILKDGWCSSIIFREVLAFYESFSQGKTLNIAPPVPYRNYILWLEKQDLEQAEKFWRNNLQGFSSPNLLKTTLSRNLNRNKDFNYQETSLKLSEVLSDNLQKICRQHKLTLNSIFQGVWALLLSHYSGESDIVFGGTVSGRPPQLPGVESMVGLFINTLPVRISIPRNETLISWLQKLVNQQIERESYSYSSLVDIQSWSEVPSKFPLFDSILIFENYPIATSLSQQSNGITVEKVQTLDITHYPLSITIMPGSEINIEMGYLAWGHKKL